MSDYQIGKTFGKLTISSKPYQKRFKIRNYKVVLCDCRCGSTVEARFYDLISGHVASCGCLRRDIINHGEARSGRKTLEFKRWEGMKERVFGNNPKNFKSYKSKGITICERWLGKNGYSNFLRDMGRCPKGFTLERKNNNGNYCPENCKWATWKDQGRNREGNRWIDFNGERKTLSGWSEYTGMSRRRFVSMIGKQ